MSDFSNALPEIKRSIASKRGWGGDEMGEGERSGTHFVPGLEREREGRTL